MKKPPSLHHVIAAACALLAACAATAAEPQYPTRPVRMIVPFAPGGPTDTIARVVAQKLTEHLGQQVVVDNRAGAGGNIGMGLAANAPADGYTIAVVSSSFVVNPGLYKNIPYDPYKSFTPISNIAASPNVFTAHPSLPVKSIVELINLVKANPGKHNIGTAGIGTTPDMSARLLALTARIDLTAVPFGGAGPAVAAVVGNQLPFGCTALPPTTPYIQAGRLRGLAVTSAKRVSALPNVATMAEAGIKGQEADTLQGLLVPAGTPKAIVDRLHAEIIKIMVMPDVKQKVVALGFDIIASSPREFSAQIKAEVEKWSGVVKSAGIQVN